MSNKVFTITSEPKWNGINPPLSANVVEEWLNEVALGAIVKHMKARNNDFETPLTLNWVENGEEQYVRIDWKKSVFQDLFGSKWMMKWVDYGMEYDSKMLLELIK